MAFRFTLKSALNALRRNKSRSMLTILGIVIGITAIILVMALGKGAQDLILAQIQGLGSKTIVILPGRQPKGPTDTLQSFGDSLKDRDLTALKRTENVPTLSKLGPLVFGTAPVLYGNETYRPTIFGVAGLFAEIYDLSPQQGVFFTDNDVKTIAPVAVIGSKTKEELFGVSNAVGEKIRIKNKNYRIIGVLPQKGQSFINFDEAVFVPYTAAQHYILGIKYFNRIVVEADTEANISRTVEDIKITLRNSHGITDPEKDDFNVVTQEDALKTVSSITNVLTLFLVSMAAISLVVGGVGIMNIMLVAVTERTREIGLRKALGATERNILTQFLIEAVILTALGGFVGLALGAGLAFIISLVLSKVANLAWIFAFPVKGAFLGLSVSAFVGLIFGLYPARKASQKSPIEALRYE